MAATGRVLLIVKDDQFFSRSNHGTIWGTVYFQIGGDTFFPGTGWTDMVAAFAVAWLEALRRIAGGTTTKESVPFFDGPLWIEMFLFSEGLVEMKFIHREEVKTVATAPILDLLRDAEPAAETLLSMCHRKGWINEDTETLNELIENGREIH